MDDSTPLPRYRMRQPVSLLAPVQPNRPGEHRLVGEAVLAGQALVQPEQRPDIQGQGSDVPEHAGRQEL